MRPNALRHFSGACFALGLGLLLAGCASTRQAAPIRDVHSAKPKADMAARPAVAPAVVLPPAPPGFYRIQPGDTLYKIAFELSLDFQALAEWNRLTTPDRIIAGELLRTTPAVTSPAATSPKTVVTTQAAPLPHKIETRTLPALQSPPPAQTVTTAMTTTAPPARAPAAQTAAIAPPLAEVAPERWDWPSKGTLLSRFGAGLSKGIDIAGERGQPVQAAAPGTVAYIGAGLRGYGKLIIIRHGKTLLSAYAHHARILVKEGDNVSRGQVIGEMGDSDADRVKLHFEIREFGKPVDPLDYLPRQG